MKQGRFYIFCFILAVSIWGSCRTGDWYASTPLLLFQDSPCIRVLPGNQSYPEHLGHIHGELCYDITGNLRCPLPQRESGSTFHNHRPECFDIADPEPALPGISKFTLTGILCGAFGLFLLYLQKLRSTVPVPFFRSGS